MNADQLVMAMAVTRTTLAQLAAATGISEATINRVRRGHVAARTDTMERLEAWFVRQGVRFRTENGVAWVGVERFLDRR